MKTQGGLISRLSIVLWDKLNLLDSFIPDFIADLLKSVNREMKDAVLSLMKYSPVSITELFP